MAKKKHKTDLFAFWRYATHYATSPWLGGHVTEFEPDGWVVTEEFPHKAFRPALILPVREGEALMAKIREVDLARAGEHAILEQKYDDLFRSLHNGLVK